MPKCTCCGKRIKKGEMSCQFCGTVYHDPNNSTIIEKTGDVDFFAAETKEEEGYSFDFSDYEEKKPEAKPAEPVKPEAKPYNPIPADPVPKKNGSNAGKILAVALCVVVISVIVVVLGVLGIQKYQKEKEEQAKAAWQAKYFVIFDDYYTRRDFDSIMNILDDTFEEEGYYPYEWEHYDLISVYENYQEFLERKDTFFEDEELTQKWTLYDAMFIDYSASDERYGLSDEDKQIIKEWTKDTEAFYKDILKLDEDEIEVMKEYISGDNAVHFPSSEKCLEYVQKFL